MSFRSPILPLALLALLCACESAAPAEEPENSPAAAAEPAKDPSAETAKKQRQLELARLELAIAESKSEARVRKSQDELDAAEVALGRASEALRHFVQVEKELATSKAQLDLEQAAWRLEERKQELAELQAMYSKDDVATLTKELVLTRGTKQVEFATRALEHERREADSKIGHELPRKEGELTQSKRKAENELREAQADRQRTVSEVELDLKKARGAIEDAELALKKAEAGKAEKP